MKKYRNVVQIVGYIKYLLLNDKYKMKCERPASYSQALNDKK